MANNKEEKKEKSQTENDSIKISSAKIIKESLLLLENKKNAFLGVVSIVVGLVAITFGVVSITFVHLGTIVGMKETIIDLVLGGR